MIVHRPHRGSLTNSMNGKREFSSLKECLETLIKEHNEKPYSFKIQMSDIYIIPYGEDERVGWKDMFMICCVPYPLVSDKDGYIAYYGDKFYHPLELFGFFTTYTS